MCQSVQLGGVEAVAGWRAAADEEDCRGEGDGARFEEFGAVLDEASEGGEPGAGAEHQERGLRGLQWEAELFVGGGHGDLDLCAGAEGFQVGACDACEGLGWV